MDIGFLITSYNRQEPCQRLVDSIRGIGEVIVVHDGEGYEIKGATNYYSEIHRGKPRYWEVVNKLFSLRGKHDYYIMLPDDFMLAPDKVDDIVGLWNRIKDPLKICLSIWQPRTVPCWTSAMPKEVGDVILSQWVDMCFICEDTFFRNLGNIKAVDYVWDRMPNISSGVGRQITKTLYGRGFNMYQVKEALVSQQEGLESQMHNTSNYGNGRSSINTRKGQPIREDLR